MSADWPRAAEWLSRTSDDPAAMVVAGYPLSAGSVTPARYDLAPAAIRSGLSRLSTFHGERGIDVDPVPVRDLGDALEPPPLDAPLTVVLGGHNAITHHVLASNASLDGWGLLTLDAHHDVRPYDREVGNGSPVRASVDAGLPGRNVVQVGIQGFCNSPSHRVWCEEQGFTLVGPDRATLAPDLIDALGARCDHVYVDLDIDVLDRAFAPGCPGARPGGISPRVLFDAAFAAGAHPKVRVVDIVEVDPATDVADLTVYAAAICLLNVAAGFATRGRR